MKLRLQFIPRSNTIYCDTAKMSNYLFCLSTIYNKDEKYSLYLGTYKGKKISDNGVDLLW